MISSDHRVDLSLDFLVVGGGIAGLSVAYVLAQAGHRIRVVEKRNLDVPAGGIRVPPNLSKILASWVGEKELARLALPCTATPLRNLNTGEDVGVLHWKHDVMKEMGGGFLTMHHEDLQRLLYKLATSAGVRVDLETSVTAIHQGDENLPNPSISLSTGELVTADFLIGADGPRSTVRDVVLERDDDAKPSFLTVYTTTILGSEMRNDPDLLRLLESDEWPIWMGEHRSVCGHPVRSCKDYAIHVYSHEGDPHNPLAGEETWEDVLSVDAVDFSSHGLIVQKLMKLAPFFLRTRLMRRPMGIEDWVDASGRIVLIGEAAHPWQPGGTHGASMAVEDAVVFGSIFSRLSDWREVPSFLSAYQEVRKARCDEVRASDIRNAQMVAMPAGPERDARDEDMRKNSVEKWDEGATKQSFGELAWVFGYNAMDAADEWWVNWGRFSESARTATAIRHIGMDWNNSLRLETEERVEGII